MQIGDPKDAVRNGVRRVLRQVILVFPFVKVFAYVMEGLKSKNARQRTECLDELSFLIETYGMNIAPQAAENGFRLTQPKGYKLSHPGTTHA